MENCPFQNDIVNVQIWDNGLQVCNKGLGKMLASAETVFNFDCGNGYRAVVTNNVKKLEITAADGWKPSLFRDDYHFQVTTCYMTDNRIIRGSKIEGTWGGGDCAMCYRPYMCGDYICPKDKAICKL
jgi:hypothetical protein